MHKAIRLTRKSGATSILEALNRRAQSQAFDIEELRWTRTADRSKPWEPEGLGSLSFLPSFASLTAPERRRCNQLHALGVCEQFIWFEGSLIEVVRRLLRRSADLPASLEQALRHFVAEEEKHVAMFRRLLERSEPDWYRGSGPRLFRVSRLQQLAMDFTARCPRLLVAWVWLAIFVEERTLYISRLHMRAAKRTPGLIDPLHAEVHAFHHRDEARHCRLDEHLLAWLYDSQPRWKRALGAWMFGRVLRTFIGGRRTAARILSRLAAEHPRLRAALLPRMHAELRTLARNPEYQRMHFSATAQPRTLALLARYPEHDALWALLPAARKKLPRS